MAIWWTEKANGLWVAGGYNSAKTSFLFWATTDFILVSDANVPPNFPFYTDGLSPDATPHSA